MNYGRYKIVKELGRGAMGVVYQAHDPQIDRLVALKALREDRVTSDEFVKRFLKEAKAVGRLSHPGIVTVYDIGQDHETIYIAMEYLDGVPLDAVMDGQKFTPEEIVDIGVQVAVALDYAHQKGIVHRDIKPPNIICTADGTVKVTDFGIARIEDAAGQQQTRAGEILGTPLYMSPEQVSGLTVDGRSDIYSLGLILYELATGHRPFKGTNLTTIFKAITNDLPQPPIEIVQDLPMQLSAVIMRCLDKDPDKRYAGGRELADALNNCLQKTPTRPVRQGKPATGKKKKNPGVALMLLLALLGGISAIIIPHVFPPGPPPTISEPEHEKTLETPVEPVEPSETSPVLTPLENLADIRMGASKPESPSAPPETATEEREPDNVDFLFQPPEKKVESGQPPPSVMTRIEPREKKKTIPRSMEPTRPKSVTTLDKTQFDLMAPDNELDLTEPVENPPIPDTPPVIATSREPDQAREPVVFTTLMIKSRPDGAGVFVNGEFKANTPADIRLPAGKYEVQLRLKDHLDWQAQLDLTRGGEVPLSLRLLPEE